MRLINMELTRGDAEVITPGAGVGGDREDLRATGLRFAPHWAGEEWPTPGQRARAVGEGGVTAALFIAIALFGALVSVVAFYDKDRRLLTSGVLVVVVAGVLALSAW
ncbi:hypothetical protein AB7M46_009014 [Bradyrhizobium elkanii]